MFGCLIGLFVFVLLCMLGNMYECACVCLFVCLIVCVCMRAFCLFVRFVWVEYMHV